MYRRSLLLPRGACARNNGPLFPPARLYLSVHLVFVRSQAVFVYQICTYEMPRYGEYIFPGWANAIGILIGLSTLAPMPFFFIRRLWKGPVSLSRGTRTITSVQRSRGKSRRDFSISFNDSANKRQLANRLYRVPTRMPSNRRVYAGSGLVIN